jgi:Predicted phosphoesterase
MVKIGIISDIHSNKVALEAVLDDMPDIDYLVCIGDIVGYGPRPAECVEIVREECDVIIQGNHDRDIHNPEVYEANHMAYQGLLHSASELSDEQSEWLSSLPAQKDAPANFRAIHSHPAVTDMYVKPDDFPEMYKYTETYSGLILGHTHIQHAEMVGKCIVINAGSVGQPRDSDPSSAYGVVDVQENTVDLRRVEYDVEAVIEDIDDIGLPIESGWRLRDGW